MREVKYIEKRGYNKFHKYKYATESDVAEKVREALSEQNVIMLPDIVEHSTREHKNRSGNSEYIATVKVKFTFLDGDSGESLEIHSVGEGQDTGDKAIYKALTGAQKYALMKAFMIPTGDDPEADNGSDERNAGKQQNPQKIRPITKVQIENIKKKALAFAEARDRSVEEVYQALKITNLANLTKQQADACIDQLDKWLLNVKESA